MKIAVVGLGYVGLPIALALSHKFEDTIGFDINKDRIEDLKKGLDQTQEAMPEQLKDSTLRYTAEIEDLKESNFYIVAVPTPVDENNTPNLAALKAATKTVAQVVSKGDIVVFESTVYPGVTEDVCGPIIEKETGLTSGKDFKIGYSPERINPGDREHTLERVIKVVSGQDQETLDMVADVYSSVIIAGVHKATSIKVAEAAKVIENTQRDVNIALMNELSIIFDLMGISTNDVLEAAGTKWNFLKFYPGLVGGHCIGVDPYYLTSAAQQLGYHPEVILSGRKINDNMGKYIAQKAIKLMVQKGVSILNSRICVFGATFKENVPDIRNSRVPDIIHELREFGCKPLICDPLANAEEFEEEYQIKLTDISKASSDKKLDVAILAVSHEEYINDNSSSVLKHLSDDGIIIDVKSILNEEELPQGTTYWSL